MIRFAKALSAWGTPDFEDILKEELEQLDAITLPLQQALSVSSYAADSNLNVMMIKVSEQASCICAKVGIFYTGIIAGCGCADDPTPDDQRSEYCEVLIEINKITAETRVDLVAE